MTIERIMLMFKINPAQRVYMKFLSGLKIILLLVLKQNVLIDDFDFKSFVSMSLLERVYVLYTFRADHVGCLLV